MLTPFPTNFQSLDFDITASSIILDGYVTLIKIPDLSTVSVTLDGANDILGSAYEVLEVTEDNQYLYFGSIIGSWIISWIDYSSSSSSSSSSGSGSTFELKDLIESGNYSVMNVKYISTT